MGLCLTYLLGRVYGFNLTIEDINSISAELTDTVCIFSHFFSCEFDVFFKLSIKDRNMYSKHFNLERIHPEKTSSRPYQLGP